MGNIMIFLFMLGLLISFNLSAFGFGIRIQASDFIIPIIGISALSQPSFRNTIKSCRVWTIILVFTCVLLIGTVCHWLHFSTINFWGIKKIIGWGICVGYFLMGVSLYEKREDVMHALIVTSWIMGAICLIAASFAATRPLIIYSEYPRFQGFMGNPNVYGIFFAFALLLQTLVNHALPYKKETKLIGIIILALNLVGTTSRAAWGGLIFTYFIYALKTDKIKKFFMIAISFFIFFSTIMLIVLKLNFFKLSFHSVFCFFDGTRCLIESGLTYSLEERLRALVTLMPTFLQHLITGTGLGGAMTIHHGQEQYTIHNTALWFLFEMGIIGFAVFMWFVYKLATAIRTSSDVLIKALAFPMLSFAITSLVNELFYQRYFWLFVGMIICDSTKRSQKNN